MAIIYFSESTGTILGDGSSGSPYKYLRMAELQASAGDTIINVDTCLGQPDGSLSLIYNGGVYDGAGNCVEGGIIRYQEEDHWFQSASTNWTENTFVYTTGQLVGSACAYNDGVALGRMRTDRVLPRDSRYRQRLIVKTEAGTVNARIEVKNTITGNYFNFTTQAWQGTLPSAADNYVISDTGGTWEEIVTDLVVVEDSGTTVSDTVRFDAVFPAGKKAWIQFGDVEFESTWRQYSGDIYYTPLPRNAAGNPSRAVWIGSDRSIRYKAASLGVISAGKFWHTVGTSATENHLYYQLAAGEDITVFNNPVYAQRLVNGVTDTSVTSLRNCTFTGFYRGIVTSTGTTTTSNVTCEDNYFLNFTVIGTGSQVNRQPIARRTYGNQAAGGTDHPKGFFVQDTAASTGSMTCYGALSEDIYDDHFQTTGGNLTIHGFTCSGSQNGSGLSLHTENTKNGDLVATNGTIYHENNNVAGVKDQNSNAGNKLTLNGVVVVCSDESYPAMEYGAGTADADLTDSGTNNYHNGTADAGYSPYVTDVTNIAGFGFEDLTNFTPSSTSVLLGQGSKNWAGGNPTGKNGEPIADFDTDAGGNQSTHSPFHPVNL